MVVVGNTAVHSVDSSNAGSSWSTSIADLSINMTAPFILQDISIDSSGNAIAGWIGENQKKIQITSGVLLPASIWQSLSSMQIFR